MANAVYDVEINGIGYAVRAGSYQEIGRAALLARTQAQAATGELDFGLGFPYPQRSWVLGEQQFYTHEYDEQAQAALRRYEEGHGVDVSRDGRLTLLPALTLSNNLVASPSTCPMCTDLTGGIIFAFPAGETDMHIFDGASWTTEAITGCVEPVTDCVNSGVEIWIVDSNSAGSRVLRRSEEGDWSRVTVETRSDAFGYTTVGTNAVTLATDTVHVDKFAVPWDCDIDSIWVYLDGAGAGSGDQVLKAIVYEDDADTFYPATLLGTSAEVTVTDGQTAGWVEFAFSTAVAVSSGNVNIGLLCGDNTNTTRVYNTTSTDYWHATVADTYSGGAAESFGAGATLSTNAYALYGVVTRTSSGWAETSYNDATAIVYTNGEHYVMTPDEVYAHDAEIIVSTWIGGSIACSYAGSVFWSDGSNRVYRYNGTGTQLIMEDLPTGFQVQSLFAAHSRLWACGLLPNGDGAVYWYQSGQYGVGTYLEAGAGSTREIHAGAADIEHVIFADSRYTSTRHYAAEGGWSHYLEYGTPGTELGSTTIPYKGLTVGAGHVAICLATGDGESQGIYVDSLTAYVSSGYLTSSQSDLQMPAHSKAWSALTVQALPIRTTEKVKIEYSLDGGRMWATPAYMSLPGTTEETFAMVGDSNTCQYRVTLYAETLTRATAPELQSVTMRGHPIVRAAKQWTFVVLGGEISPTRNENKTQDNEDRVEALIGLSRRVTPVNFRSLDGKTYTVVVRPYIWQPMWNKAKTKLSMTVQVTLDQVEI